MNVNSATVILADALSHCRARRHATKEVIAALEYLDSLATEEWPFAQFRFAFNIDDGERRWQTLNTSLNGIRRLFPNLSQRHQF